jgi:hypothetical protein
MILRKNICKNNNDHQFVVDYIENNFPTNSRILDIGGAANCWAKKHVTHLADYFCDDSHRNEFTGTNIIFYDIDIENYENWKPVFEDVEKNGLFDFVICTHTLEDLNYPENICKIINRIGKQGFISVPSKYSEYCIFESHLNLNGHRGYHHHRWIYRLKNDILIGYPKMNTWDKYNNTNLEKANSTYTEINFLWKDNFKFNFISPHQLLDNRKGPPLIHEIAEMDDLILP